MPRKRRKVIQSTAKTAPKERTRLADGGIFYPRADTRPILASEDGCALIVPRPVAQPNPDNRPPARNWLSFPEAWLASWNAAQLDAACRAVDTGLVALLTVVTRGMLAYELVKH